MMLCPASPSPRSGMISAHENSAESSVRQHANFLLIGGGIAADTAAQTLRDEGETGSILMLSGESFLPYNRPSLIGGLLTGERNASQILVRPPEAYQQNRLDIRLDTKVVRIDPSQHLVVDANGQEYQYDRLLIATGARSRHLNVPGAGLAGIFHLRTLADALTLRQALTRGDVVIIIGSSFIAMEAATALVRMGLAVTLIDKADTVFPKIESPQLAAFFLDRCRQHGIAVRLHETVASFRRADSASGQVSGVVTGSGETLACNAVLLAIGVDPQTECLEGSGIAVEDGVLVDEFLCSSDRDIFAAGDVACYPNADGSRTRTEHWDNARAQGLVAARNMLGQRVPYEDVPHYFCDFLDFSFSFLGRSTGAEERIARGDIHSGSFAEFYLRDSRIIGLFSTGRPPEETTTVDVLIRQRVRVGNALHDLTDPNADLGALARTTVLILQGGGALGAFECGVVRAMEEAGIAPGIVGGVSVGALNGAIIAGNPGHAFEALDAFWAELSLHSGLGWEASCAGRGLANWSTMVFGVPGFFRPRWFAPPVPGEALPWQWTSLYDAEPLGRLLEKYVDFSRLASSPTRLIVGAVDVELGALTFFDTRVDQLSSAHILASCSLPPVFRWTTIGARHYWDGGIVSNSPLEHVLQICGTDNKEVVIVDLFPDARPLPANLADVVSRYAEITYAERVRNDARVRETLREYQALVDEIMLAIDPEKAARLRERPRYVHLMGRGDEPVIIRIVRSGQDGQPSAADYDFSEATIGRHKRAGYDAARKRLSMTPAFGLNAL